MKKLDEEHFKLLNEPHQYDNRELEHIQNIERIREKAMQLIIGDNLETMTYHEFFDIISFPGVIDQTASILVELLDNKQKIREYLLNNMSKGGAMQSITKRNKDFTKRAQAEANYLKKNYVPKQKKVKIVKRLLNHKDRYLLALLKN